MSEDIRDGLADTDSGADVSEGETDDTGADSGVEKLLSQADVDRLVTKRLKRQEEQFNKKYADYDARVEESENFRKLQDEKSTDAQRWENERNKFLADLQSKDEALTKLQRSGLIADLASDKGLPKSFWKRVQGDTEEEIAEDMDSIIKDLGLDKDQGNGKEKTPTPPRKKGATYGGGGATEDPDPDIDAIVARIPRGPQIRVK